MLSLAIPSCVRMYPTHQVCRDAPGDHGLTRPVVLFAGSRLDCLLQLDAIAAAEKNLGGRSLCYMRKKEILRAHCA